MSESKLEVVEKTKKLVIKYGKVKSIKTIQRDPFIPESLIDEIRKRINKMKVITPNEISNKFNVRVSAAKKLLEQFEEEGLIKMVASSSRLRIYKNA